MINSRQKGKRVERAWRDVLNEAGFVGTVRDGQQGFGVNGNSYHPDVLSPMLPNLHWEVKGVEKLNVREALQQAIDDAPQGKTPVVAWKKKNKEWTVTLRADDFLKLLKKHQPNMETATLPIAEEIRTGDYVAETADDLPGVFGDN